MKLFNIRPIFRRIFQTVLAAIMIFFLFVLLVNRNSNNMTLRQKILKAVYPVTMWFTGKTAKSTSPTRALTPPKSIYNLAATLNNGQVFKMEQMRGKRFMIVNTASDCGYTGQYDGLEKLYQAYKDQLVILAFPANDFKDQEKGSDEDIAAFCRLNYGITFPLMKKSTVMKKPGQAEVFAWLTHKDQNGWNDSDPTWNFSKYIVDEQGRLVQVFGPGIEPTGPEVLELVSK